MKLALAASTCASWVVAWHVASADSKSALLTYLPIVHTEEVVQTREFGVPGRTTGDGQAGRPVNQAWSSVSQSPNRRSAAARSPVSSSSLITTSCKRRFYP
jgi:hypothetical protein